MSRKKSPIQVEAVTPQPYKIAILGTATTSIHNAPYNDPSWKIWDMSMNFTYGRRHNLFFEIHTPEILLTYPNTGKYFEFLKKAGKTVIVGHPSAEYWPEAQELPLQAIMQMLDTDYFTCSAAYMIAFAVYLHKQGIASGGQPVAEIGLWGIDMASMEGEYQHQRPCVDYWIGVARGSGIKVTIAKESPIARCGAMYGFENLAMSRELTSKILEMGKVIAQLEHDAREQGLMGIRINPIIEKLSNLRFAKNELTLHMNRFGL